MENVCEQFLRWPMIASWSAFQLTTLSVLACGRSPWNLCGELRTTSAKAHRQPAHDSCSNKMLNCRAVTVSRLLDITFLQCSAWGMFQPFPFNSIGGRRRAWGRPVFKKKPLSCWSLIDITWREAQYQIIIIWWNQLSVENYVRVDASRKFPRPYPVTMEMRRSVWFPVC